MTAAPSRGRRSEFLKNGWTGGQYSLYRAVFGVYLLVHFIALLPWAVELFSNRGVLPGRASPLFHLFPNILVIDDAPAAVIALVAAALVASIFFLLGVHDRAASVFLWYVLACLFGRNPLIANPSLPFVGWLLLAHVFTPPAPYGSWSARRRLDPRGSWFMPRELFAAAWIVMAIGYSYSGYSKLVSPSWVDGSALRRVLGNPLARPGALRNLVLAMPPLILTVATWAALSLELLYAPLALLRRARVWIWTAMVALHLGLMILIDFADLSFGMMILHLATFDPRWVPDRWVERRDRVFYDGACGLCHGAVRFALAEGSSGAAFTFAPLQGQTAAIAIPKQQRAALPDSIVVQTETGELLIRSNAVLYMLERLGGFWRVIAVLLRVAPRSLRDAVYNGVARIRYRLFARPDGLCPLMPPAFRRRFED